MAQKLFGGTPDLERVAADVGVETETALALVNELAFICKTVTRLDRGFILNGQPFARPGSEADRTHTARWWVEPQELSNTLADRSFRSQDLADAVVDSIEEQLGELEGELRVALAWVELERGIEIQLVADIGVLAPWGWDLHDPVRQVRLGSAGIADVVARTPGGDYVVIELKRGAALESTAEQVLRYMDALASLPEVEGRQVTGLVVADGADSEFHDAVAASRESVEYQPVRALNLPACRPQTHIIGAAPRERRLVVAADGRTVVGATPSIASFTRSAPESLHELGMKYLSGTTRPLPVDLLQISS